MAVTRRMTTKIIHTSIINKQTRLSKKTQNAGDVKGSMTPEVADRKMLCVIRVIKGVTYPHAVRMSKTSALKETKTLVFRVP